MNQAEAELRRKIIFAKRVAMQMNFFCACPEDDDHGFDRLMTLTQDDQIETAIRGVYNYFAEDKKVDIDSYQRRLFEEACKLMSNFMDIDLNSASKLLRQVKTTQVNPGGVYTECDFDPAKKIPQRVVVVIEGGVVQTAIADKPMEVAVVDYDNDADPADQFLVPQTNGDEAVAIGGVHSVEVDPVRAAELFHAVEDPRPVAGMRP